MAHRAQENTCTYIYWFLIEDTAQEQANGREAQGEVCRKGHGVSGALSGCTTLPEPACPPTLKLIKSHARVFMELDLQSPLPFLEVGGWS